MSICRCLSAVCAALCLSQGLRAEETENPLLAAAETGDATAIPFALAEFPVDSRDAEGRTALMLAARSGNFETVRQLLWNDARANLKDQEGNTALDLLDPAAEESAALSLMLRCYGFCQEYSRPGGKARIPHLTLINDYWVDPTHPELRPLYATNLQELHGRDGVDDDRNGFVDDIYGWNLALDQPLAEPRLGIDPSPETRDLLQRLWNDAAAADAGDSKLGTLLHNRHLNPLAKSIGPNILAVGGVALDDAAYVRLWRAASHGTQVAGIVAKASDRKARLTTASIAISGSINDQVSDDVEGLSVLAGNAPDYAAFITAVLDRYRNDSVTNSRRASDCIRSSGAGIALMSWSRSRLGQEAFGHHLENLYRRYGQNPESIDAPASERAADLAARLSQELLVANACALALIVHENPDLLIVVAAGDAAQNNDDLLTCPPYLSRLFPNVVTVASVNGENAPSGFSNFGLRSVQLAALGENVASTLLGGLEGAFTGTSAAAPQVAGAAAGIRADFPSLNAAEIRRLLESSAAVSPALARHVSTSGVLDAEAARSLAASRCLPNRMILDSPASGGGAAKPAVPDSLEAPAVAPDSAPPLHLQILAGSPDTWRAVMRPAVAGAKQRILLPSACEKSAIQKAWDEGYRITTIGGAADQWSFVMTTGVAGEQIVTHGIPDPKAISARLAEGYRITALAGSGKDWLMVLSTATGWGEQIRTLPGPLDARRADWIGKRLAEGYRVTSIAGTDRSDNDTANGWMIVMTRDTGLGEQRFTGPGPWPESWIAEQTAQGFAISAIAGSGERTVVIMTQGAADAQIVSPEGPFPRRWIEDQW